MEQEQYALGIALIFSVACDVILYRVFKTRMYSLVFYISTFSLLFTLIFWLFTRNYILTPNIYLIFCELWVVLLFMLLRVSRIFIISKFSREKDPLQKMFINGFFHAASLMQYLLTIHLLIVLLDRQLRFGIPEYQIPDAIIFVIIPISAIFLLGLLQAVKIKSLDSKLKTEEWLPIVAEKGEVTGKIAKSVSLRMKNKFLHPVVRVALISNGKVYLQERSADDILDPRKLDYPFEKYTLFSHDIETSARNSIKRLVGDEINLPIDFLLKYIFENHETKRLVFLFVARIEDEHLIKREGKMHGKFWTIKQVEEGFADEIFAECFELEFEYLKNMVLAPESDIHIAKSL